MDRAGGDWAGDPLEIGRTPLPPVLRSKLTRPASLTDVVARVGLARTIVTAPAPVVVVTAPAGYGKTTLLVEAAEALGHASAWLTVDAGDNDPARFWIHVGAALEGIGVPTGRVRTSLRHDDPRPVDELIAAIESNGTAVTLVLDDVHELVEPEVIEQCSRLISNPPACLRVFVTSRVDLAWPIAKLRTRGTVLEVGVEQLRLAGEDGRAVLAEEIADGLIDERIASEVVDRVEGWPAGLLLAKLAIRAGEDHSNLSGLVAGDRGGIARYLAGEVLDRRPLDEREFLLATSILDELTPGACDAVTGGAGSLAMLRSLVSNHLFTTMTDPSRPTFAYHQLMREFLQSRLDERGADDVARLHLRALNYFERTDDVGAIVRHGVAAGRSDVALDRLSDEYINLADAGRIGELWRLIGVIGPEQVLAHALLSTTPAWASLNLGRYDEIEPWLQSFALLDDVSPLLQVEFELSAESLRCHRDRHLGDLEGSLGHALEAIARVDATSDQIIASTVLSTAGAALALSGETEAARSTLRRAIRVGHESGETTSIVVAYSYLALITDDGDEALAHVDNALSMITSPDLERFHIPAVAWLVRGRHALAAGRVGDAAEALARAQRLAESGREPLVSAMIAMTQARRHHLLGEHDEHRSALRRMDVLLKDTSGTSWLREQAKAAQAATRFAPLDDAHLPIGARELTARELAVLRLLPHGLSRKELSAQLFVSENTVKTHLTSIRHKLGVRGRDDVVAAAIAFGLLQE